MVDVITGLYDFTLPEVGGSDDTWGDKNNANWQKMETLLAGTFPAGTPASLKADFRLDALTVGNIGDISVVNPLDPLNMSVRFGRNSPTGNISLYVLNPGTTSARVQLRSEGTGSVIAGVGKFGSVYIGATPADAASPTMVSAATGSVLSLRSGVDTSQMILFRNATGTVVAYIDLAGTVSAGAAGIITQEKGDARYLQAVAGETGSNLTIKNTYPTITLLDTSPTAGEPDGYQISGGNGNLYIYKTDAAGAAIAPPLFDLTPARLSIRVPTSIAGTGANVWIGATPAGSATSAASVAAETGSLLVLRSGLDTGNLIQFRNFSNGIAAYIDPAGTAAGGSGVVMTREKGDLRYASASSERFKEQLAPRSTQTLLDIFDKLVPSQWTWGGEIPESDERHGTPGVGFSAEATETVFPEAVRYQWVPAGVDDEGEPLPETEKRVHGLDPLALIAVLHAKIASQDARIATLEATP